MLEPETERLLGLTADSTMPAFRRYHTEAAIIGRMLTGYGELEFELGKCLGAVVGGDQAALRMLFRVRGEKQRIQIADALMRERYIERGLKDEYCETLSAMHHCRVIRNQYAHCHWLDDVAGLFFLNMEEAAAYHGHLSVMLRHLDTPLLQEQEGFFRYTERCLLFLSYEQKRLEGKLAIHPFAKPQGRPRPRQYNPPGSHPPPKLEQSSQTPPQEDQ